MMPWEHAMLGYVAYSILLRVLQSAPPTPTETVAVGFASVLPDLVDKPLAWQYDLFLSGHAVGHSVFVAVPVSVAFLFVAWRRGWTRAGVGFGIGYLFHLPGDLLGQYLRGGPIPFHRVLWPLRHEGSGYEAGFREELIENLVEYSQWLLRELSSGDPEPYLFVLFGLGVASGLLWVADGMPIVRELYGMLRDGLGARSR